MAADFEVRDADDLRRISKACREAGAADLKKQLNKGLREGVKPLTVKNREAAAHLLPHKGGLAKRVAKAPQRTRIRTGATPGVSLVAGKAGSAARAADEGLIRHPVFGTGTFVTQHVRPGWFTRTNEANKDLILPALRKAMDAVAEQIERRTR